MRNYEGFRIGNREFKAKRIKKNESKGEEKKESYLVIEDNTIYEVDAECMDCFEKYKEI